MVKTNETKTTALNSSMELQEIGEKIKSPIKSVESSPNYDLSKFRTSRILNNNTRNKSIAILGTFPDLSETDNAIVVFEKRAFKESEVNTTTASTATIENDNTKNNTNDNTKNNTNDNTNDNTKNNTNDNTKSEKIDKTPSTTYFCDDLKVDTEFINNIYGSYQCVPPADLNCVKATVVYPATDKHISKYTTLTRYLVNETPELYEKCTLPYINSTPMSLEWVYNILEHKQEVERIVFEDTDPENGFTLLPDLKWDGKTVESLYLLAIAHKRNIKSLRDLNASHLPLLRNIRQQAGAIIKERYNVASNQLRMYFHYQPSFYHLHVHINLIVNDAQGIWCEKSHLLDTVIDNISLLDNYYQKATLPFVIYAGTKLFEIFEGKSCSGNMIKSAKRPADDTDADAVNTITAKKSKPTEDSCKE